MENENNKNTLTNILDSQTVKDVTHTLSDFIRHPIATAGSSEQVPVFAGIILVLIKSLAWFLFSTLGSRLLLGTFLPFNASFLVPIIANLVPALVLVLILTVLLLIGKNKKPLATAVGAAALSDIPIILSYILLTIQSFFLGALPQLIGQLMVFTYVFALVFSVLILEKALSTKIKGEAKKIFAVAISVAVKISISLFLISLLLDQSIVEMVKLLLG